MKYTFVLALAAGSVLGSCCSFRPKRQVVTITASDPSAQLFVNGIGVGMGSAVVKVQRK